MFNAKEYRKAFAKMKSLASLIPLESFVNDHAIYTRSGSAVTTFITDKIDPECLGMDERKHITNRLIAAHTLFDPSIRHYQYLIKQRSGKIAGESWNGERVQFLRERAKHGTVELYQAIESQLSLSAKLRAKLDPESREKMYRKALRQLEIVSRAYEIQLSDLTRPQVLSKAEAFGFYRRLLNIGTHWAEGRDLASDTGLARQLGDAHIYWDKDRECLRVGRRCVRVFTLKDLPDSTLPNALGELLKVDADMVISLSWQAIERLNIMGFLRGQKNVVFNLERSTAGLKSAGREDRTAYDVMTDEAANDVLRELNQAIKRQGNQGGYAGLFSLTLLVHGNTGDDLEEAIAEIGKVFKVKGAALTEESGAAVLGGALPSFFSILPGNQALNLREMKLENQHYADFTFAWGPETGSTRSSVLDDDYANVYETRAGSLFYDDTHYNLVAARATFGMTRSGKTVYELDRIDALQAKKPLTYIFDIGKSYETLAAKHGGSVLRFSLDKLNVKLNPFAGEFSADYREFLLQFLQVLIERFGYAMQPEDHKQLDQKLSAFYRMSEGNPSLRRLKQLQIVLSGPMKDELAKWCEGGRYGMLFDHAEDTLALAEFQVFEFEGIQHNQEPPPWVDPMQMLLMYRVGREVTADSNLRRLKSITIDEAAMQLRRKIAADFTVGSLKTWQKKLAMISIVTQSPSDLGALEPFILESCSSFAFFPNPKVKDEVLRSKFQFDDEKIRIFRSLVPREFLFNAQRATGEIWKVLRLEVDPQRYWTYSTSPLEQAKRNDAIAEHGMSEGLAMLAAAGK